MRHAVAEKHEPIYSGFLKLREHPQSLLSFVAPAASKEVGRNPQVRAREFEEACNAAYQCAVLGCITEDVAYLARSKNIVDDWAETLQGITGADAILCAALGGFKLINAAELLRWNTVSPWPVMRIEKFQTWIRNVILPVLDGFAPFANGNWDTAAMKTLMASAVFLEDRELFDRVLVYYMHGCGDGRLENYVYSNGQCQESGRDQQHTQLGIAHLAECCEIAWKQGLNLYGMADNRLLKGFEYTAKYELGEDVPFHPDQDKTGKYSHQQISPRSPLRAIYEQVYNHYVKRCGLKAPWTEKAAATLRPEGAVFGADNIGFGTLLYSRPEGPDIAEAYPFAVPGGLYAENEAGTIKLSWIPLAASPFTVVRRVDIARQITRSSKVNDDTWRDSNIKVAQLYRYTVEGPDGRRAIATRAVSGIPHLWKVESELPEKVKVFASDESQWRIDAGGDSIPDGSGATAAVAKEITGDATCIARLLPEFASIKLRAGVIAFDSETKGGVLCIVTPGLPDEKTNERQRWGVELCARERHGQAWQRIGQVAFESPAVEYGRLRMPVELRLQRQEKYIYGSFSLNGRTWEDLGRWEMPQRKALRMGLAASSGTGETATVLFDRVGVFVSAPRLAAHSRNDE